jgi:hypothetical protein
MTKREPFDLQRVNLCKNCGINEREEPYGWCSSCLDQPRKPFDNEQPKRKIKSDRAKSRQVWRIANNKTIPKGWHIHHIDGNAMNNEPSNLVCITLENHIKIHQDKGDTAAVILLKKNNTTRLD